jgi:hypothetical protein
MVKALAMPEETPGHAIRPASAELRTDRTAGGSGLPSAILRWAFRRAVAAARRRSLVEPVQQGVDVGPVAQV